MVKLKSDYTVAIVGAGPYGLSLANYLSSQGTSFIIFGKTFDLWRKHTFDTMNLRSDYATSELSHPNDRYRFSHYCSDTGISVNDISGQLPVSVFRNYIDWCLARIPFSVNNQMIINIKHGNSGFSIQTEKGDKILVQKVVLATGIAHQLYIPEIFLAHPGTLHSYRTAEIQKINAKKVLVVGSGQSAAESIFVLLKNKNQVEWYTRTAPVYFSEPLNLPRWLFNYIIRLPQFFRNVDPIILKRTLGLFSSTTITPDLMSVVKNVPHHYGLPDMDKYDVIISATGYQYQMNDLKFLSAALKAGIRQWNQYPVVSHRFESSTPGLFFSGAITEPFFGPSMKFMIGAPYSASVIARAIK